MGGWFSTARPQQQDPSQDRSTKFRTQVFSKSKRLTLESTLEELCSDDEGGEADGWNIVDSDDEGDMDADEEELLWAQELRSNPKNRVWDESKSCLENRRPAFYWAFFGWPGVRLRR
jgi:hypothetical protein